MRLNPIVWRNLSKAIDYYVYRCRYQYAEVPWIAEMDSIGVTLPNLDRCFKFVNNEEFGLVGSAEQSFLDMILQNGIAENTLEPNRAYVACTPCFRNEGPEDIETGIKHFWFMKVELFCYTFDGVPSYSAHSMLDDASNFFKHISGIQPEVVKTDIGNDLEINGIEVGSYGMRHVLTERGDLVWNYGTGIAEPRLTQAIKFKK